jgi:hypothetical protein
VDIVLAVNNFGDTRSGGLAGPAGLLVIVLMAIATVLLIRNMNKRLRRLPDSFPDPRVTEREAEITRLDADLRRSGPESAGRDVDNGRSPAPGVGAEVEVSGVDTTDRPDPDGTGTARA